MEQVKFSILSIGFDGEFRPPGKTKRRGLTNPSTKAPCERTKTSFLSNSPPPGRQAPDPKAYSVLDVANLPPSPWFGTLRFGAARAGTELFESKHVAQPASTSQAPA